ncbi:MFS transporter [Acidianus sp. RZ1]|uniref:MFS transporter n=1 Tax=Acidianus sp. RZ1 TaxID=1540082 RepID=UPI001491C085|nr:MFS transporter [Acidianus sp. RZ1]NON61950.1 MFS transporter [Acidianus sp. RZ1]
MKDRSTFNFVGSYLSWIMDSYDLGAVVITASILEKLYYPSLGVLGAILPVVFTVMFRPLGGFIFGFLSDTRGRKKVLIFTVLGYSFSIGITAILPTYYQIGIVAPLILSLLRIFQGIFIGGDVSSSFTISMESVNRHRGLASGIMQSGTLVGFVIVDMLFTELSANGSFLFSLGWRIIFAVGVFPAILAVFIRSKMTEPKIYLEAEKENPIRGLKPVFQTILVMIGFWIMIYAGPQFIPIYLGTVLHLPAHEYGFLALIMNLIGIPSMIISGMISDYIGRKSMSMFGLLIGVITALNLYTSSGNLILPILLFGFGINLPSAITPAYLAERFKTFSRATGVGFSYNGAFIAAGFSQVFISLLSYLFPTSTSAFLILLSGGILAFAGLAIGPETLKRNELHA